jgi:hypothetical protein
MASVAEVRAWADKWIACLDTPPEWLIDASLARSVGEALSAVGLSRGDVDERVVWAALMTVFRDLLSQDPDSEDLVALQLFRLAAYERGGPTPEAEGEMMTFWNGLDLARLGIVGDLSSERARLHRFLEHWSSLDSYPTDGAST